MQYIQPLPLPLPLPLFSFSFLLAAAAYAQTIMITTLHIDNISISQTFSIASYFASALSTIDALTTSASALDGQIHNANQGFKCTYN